MARRGGFELVAAEYVKPNADQNVKTDERVKPSELTSRGPAGPRIVMSEHA